MTYTVVLYNGTTVVDTKKDVSGTSIGLVGDNGQTYKVGVTATNRKGTGPEAKSDAVTPFGAPGAVTGLTATATGANGDVQLAFSAPSETGGVAAGALTYDVDFGSGWRNLAGNKLLSGLNNGTNYTIKVRANNGTKTGDSASASATPYGPVPAPTASAGKPTPTQVSFSWNATTNGLPINVTIAIDGGGKQAVGPSGSTTVGNDYDQDHSIVVESCDAKGNCKSASASARTDPRPPPPVMSVQVWKGVAWSDPSYSYIMISITNGRANSLYGCQIYTSDGDHNGTWQRNLDTDGNGYGDNANNVPAGTAWVWNGGGTVTVDCEGTRGSTSW